MDKDAKAEVNKFLRSLKNDKKYIRMNKKALNSYDDSLIIGLDDLFDLISKRTVRLAKQYHEYDYGLDTDKITKFIKSVSICNSEQADIVVEQDIIRQVKNGGFDYHHQCDTFGFMQDIANFVQGVAHQIKRIKVRFADYIVYYKSDYNQHFPELLNADSLSHFIDLLSRTIRKSKQ